MANIDQYLAEIRSAVYGEEVRGSIINALEAQNNETENNTTAAEQAVKDAQEAVTNAETAADTANTAAAGADTAAENATQAASDAADEAVKIATEAAKTAESTANAAAENANTAANAANAAAMTQIASYDITYQASSIGTEPPTGEWIHSIPTVAEGNYLWTRVIIYSVSGDETTFYSVGKMGSSSGGEGGGNLWYGLCETTGNTTAKTVACDGFTLDTGAEIIVKFSYTNTASNATMNVDSTGAYPIYYNNSNIATELLRESGTYFFVFDGAHYAVVGELSGAAIDELQQDVAQINEDLSVLNNNSLFALGTLIPNNSDLDDYQTPGKYYIASTANAQTIVNSPQYSYAFTLIVLYLNSTARLAQIQILPHPTNNANCIYIRVLSSNGWRDWQAFAYQKDINSLNTSLSELETSVSANTSSIEQNTSDISDLDEKVTQNSADIETNKTDIEENKTNIEQNASDIEEINSALADLIVVTSYQYGTITISPLSFSSQTSLSVTAPDGYKNIGVIGVNTGHNYAITCRCYLNTAGTSINATFYNGHSTDTMSLTPTIYVLAAKTSILTASAQPQSEDDPDTPTVDDPEGTPVPED